MRETSTGTQAAAVICTTLVTATVVAAAVLLFGCSSEQGGDPVPAWRTHGDTILAKAACNGHAMTCPGAALPKAALLNYNPTNSGFQQTTTLAALSQRPKVVALLAGW